MRDTNLLDDGDGDDDFFGGVRESANRATRANAAGAVVGALAGLGVGWFIWNHLAATGPLAQLVGAAVGAAVAFVVVMNVAAIVIFALFGGLSL